MRFVIVTGMSGAGKSTALKMLEDMEYFCVDNLPVPLIDKFVQLIHDSGPGEIEKVAIGVDIRSGKSLDELVSVLENIQTPGLGMEILFLDADEDVLVRRYKETRRSHPLAGNGRVDDGIRREREKLRTLKECADYILDTSKLLTRELKAELEKIFVENREFKNLMVTVLSFGFKYGIPQDADLVFDVRFLPNPHWDPKLRPMTGLDKPVAAFLDRHTEVHNFIYQTRSYLELWLPMLETNNRSYLTVAIGCTGGKHRSVYIAEQLADYFRSRGKNVQSRHRTLEKRKS